MLRKSKIRRNGAPQENSCGVFLWDYVRNPVKIDAVRQGLQKFFFCTHGRSKADLESTERKEGRGQMYTYDAKEVCFYRDGMKIYGKLFLPDRKGPLPLVIMEHGFGGNLTGMEIYAEKFTENGFAVYAFDFIGGGVESKSDGKMTEMSVLTEAADLNTVIDGLKETGLFDPENIFLFGGSQGGFVATYVASHRSGDIRALVVLYPAYVLQDDTLKRTPDPENIPETINVMGLTIGQIYNVDAMSFDIYDHMQNYTGNVLIIHGTADEIVPLDYSERAARTFPSARLVTIKGGGHGFDEEDAYTAADLAVHFVRENLYTAPSQETE